MHLKLRLHLGGRSTASRYLCLDPRRWLIALEVHRREAALFQDRPAHVGASHLVISRVHLRLLLGLHRGLVLVRLSHSLEVMVDKLLAGAELVRWRQGENLTISAD